MADPINITKTSPTVFNQTNQVPQNALAPAVSNPSIPASSAPPSAAPNISQSTPQTVSAGASPASSVGLGGGVLTPSPNLGGNVVNQLAVLGDSLLPGTPGPGSGGSSASSVTNVPILHYATVAIFTATAPASSLGIADDTNTLYILIGGVPVPIVTTP